MKKKPKMPSHVGEGECWGMFQRGDAYLVLPRVLLQGMPLEWQNRFVAMFEDMREVYDTSKCPGLYSVQLRDEKGRFKKDWMTNYKYTPLSELPYRVMKK